LRSELLPARRHGAVTIRRKAGSLAAPAPARRIRAWRQATTEGGAAPPIAAHALFQPRLARDAPASERARKALARALRGERVRSGGAAYDLNRHIALLRAWRDLRKGPRPGSIS
jgi:hypothetical protein